MRLITPDCSLIRFWMIFFALCWGIFSFLGLVLWSVVSILLGSKAFDWHWIGAGAVPFAIVIASGALRTERGERQKRSERVWLQGHHPLFGDFRYQSHSGSWFTAVELSPEWRIHLRGHGLSPSDEQVATWSEVIAPNIESIFAVASNALLPPPKPCSHATDTPLVLDDVELLGGGVFVLSFSAEAISDEIGLWPKARFSAQLALQSAEWVP
jgi:hypothetical protein